MVDFETIVSIIDFSLDTKARRHLVGGALLSISLLFSGLAITIMTINFEKEQNEDEE